MLSPKELELVNHADWILTKNAIIHKVCLLFGELSEGYRLAITDCPLLTADELGNRSPKISKGEQYEGLPWVMLDYPRNFSGDDAFAIRSFFWWGNFCSITLQLSGKFQQKYMGSLEHYFAKRATAAPPNEDWFIGTGTDPWKHHFRKDNYQPVSEWSTGSVSALPFIKVARKTPLHNWDQLDVFFEKNYREMLQMLTAY